MKILVCVKVSKGEINPFDESALEAALRLSNDVTVLSMGPKQTEEILKPLTRLGAKVILLSDSLYAGSDTLATSYILSTAIQKQEFDLIFCGRQTVDGDTAQVGPMLSQMLEIPLITNALSVSCDETGVTATTRIGEEQTTYPALITLERGYVLRFPSIFSKLGDVTLWDNTQLGCDPKRCGQQGSPTRVLQVFENERGRRLCKFITMEELRPLISELRQKKRISVVTNECPRKLKSVWAVGEEVLEKAREIAEEVVVIPKEDAATIAQKAQKAKPEIILWNADLWGRKTAPQVAALLQTGLCADCVALETDGKELYMYRPAQGGNITAKIVCDTTPKMATVRTQSESMDVIVAGGKGVADDWERLEMFAQELGAELGASRGLVDMGKAPYEHQIGLTGKMVSPNIYLAIGISGAVHHTCAIESASTVIAINPDKNARIFDYADYGILEEF